MKTPKELIQEIHINKANLDYISENGKINGSLLCSIESVMINYAKECVKASLEKAADNARTDFGRHINKSTIINEQNIVLL